MSPPVKDETGKRFGKLVVLSMHPPKTRQTGWRALCRCDCGNLRMVDTRYFRYKRPWCRRTVYACLACTDADRKSASAKTNRDTRSIRLPDGRTLGHITAATGLKIDLVYHRYIRGWPHWRLGEKPRAYRSAT